MLYLLWIFVIWIVTFVTGTAHEKVLLEHVKTITLRKGEFTTGRRSAGVPQIRCVGGSAKGQFEPRVVQCVNSGHDGFDYQWNCQADMPHNLEFGKISVSCEGFNRADDPYVLKGSCGLEYELEYRAGSHHGGARSDIKHFKSSWWTLENMLTGAVLLFIAFIFIRSMFGEATGGPGPNRPRGMGFFGGGFDQGPGYPPGGSGGYGAPPPSYDDTFGHKRSSNMGAQDGPGFWTGAGLGALGGYMFGRRNGGHSTNRNERFAHDTGFGEPQPSTSSDSMRSSTGYGGTTRR